MFKKILTIAVVAFAIHGNSCAMARFVQSATQMAANNPTATALLATLAVSAAAFRTTNAPIAQQVAAATAGALIGCGTKPVTDSVFARVCSPHLTKGSHSEAVAKKAVGALLAYWLNQAITYATARLVGATALPAAKLAGPRTPSKLFTIGMALGFLKGDFEMLRAAIK